MKVAIVCCFDTFTERQEALREVFRQRGDQVTVFQSDFSHRTKTKRTGFPAGDVVIHAKPYEKNLSVARLNSHICFARDVLKALEKQSWDLIWVILAPNSLAKRCAEYCRRHRETKLVIDVNDLWPESLPMGGIKRLPPMGYWRSLRDRALPKADAVVTECQLFRDRLGFTSDNCTVLYYCKRSNTMRKVPCIWSGNGLALCYLGSVNHIIDLDTFEGIIVALEQRFQVTLHLIADGERRAELIQRMQKAGAEVVDHGTLYGAAEKQAVFDQCQLGLNIMKPTVCVGLTMKSIDYLEAGLPILNNIHGDTWNLIQERGIGLNWDLAKGADQLDQLNLEKASRAARQFYETELTFEMFQTGVEHVLQQITEKATAK